MKVLFDHQIFCNQNHGGISRYYNELMKELSKNDTVLHPAIRSSYYHFSMKLDRNNIFLKRIINKLYIKFNENKKIETLKNNERNSIELLENSDYDIFHPTYYNPYFLKYLNNKPFVLTIYDMIHEIYPEYFLLNDETSVWKKELAEKATKIIAISENTKNDIIKYYGIDNNKIDVIYLGNSLNENLLINKTDKNVIDSLPKSYILFVGSRKIYKNFYFFIEAIAPILQKDRDLNLICIGGGPFSDDELGYYKFFNLEKKIYHYTVNDDTLIEIYKRAITLIYPSLYEGFGLPILEAFSCSCPVILSNTSSLPEIAGDAAAYFNPKDIKSMRETIYQTIYDQELLETIKQKGLNQLKKYSWEECAEKTISLYKSLL